MHRDASLALEACVIVPSGYEESLCFSAYGTHARRCANTPVRGERHCRAIRASNRACGRFEV